MIKSLSFKELSVGMIVVRDTDCFMLGDRWLITNVSENNACGEYWCCGKRAHGSSSDWVISNDEVNIFIRTDETFDSWKNKNFGLRG